MAEPLTNTITLPVSGMETVIRESDENAERILFKHKHKMYRAVPAYLAYCTVRLRDIEKPKPEDIRKLLMPDQVALAIEVYKLSFGDKVILTAKDPDTNRPAGYEVDLTELDFMPIPDGKTGPDPVFTFIMPRSGHVIEYGYPTYKQALDELELDDIDVGRTDFARIRMIDGGPKGKRGDVWWGGLDSQALRDDFHRTRCGYDTRIRFKNENGVEVVMDLLSDPSFLHPAVRLRR
jgi:hypothetical protein